MMKKFKTLASVVLLLTFLTTTVVTVALAGPPGCKRCRKEGCPQGFCYFDCVSCCYLDHGQVVCFK